MRTEPNYFQTVKSLPMPHYGLHDWDPTSGTTLEDWAQGLADKGWRTWASGRGVWVVVNGRRVYRVSLVRSAADLQAELSEKRAKAARR